MADLKKKKEHELLKDLKDKRAALQSFRFGMSGSKTRNVKEGKAIKKDIARILTELNTRHQED